MEAYKKDLAAKSSQLRERMKEKSQLTKEVADKVIQLTCLLFAATALLYFS